MLSLCRITALSLIALPPFGAASAPGQEPTPLKSSRLIIEYNATDDDLGFQGFIDGEGWQNLSISGPAGEILRIDGVGALGNHGLTELFFETVEPAELDMPKAHVLGVLPAGEYTISGRGIEAGEETGATIGTALLTHDIPEGPQLLLPAEDATVPAKSLRFEWLPVTETIDARPVQIVAYQLIVEKNAEPLPNMIGKFGLSIYVPASVTSIEVPAGFLEPATGYNWEVLAIEASGNQSLRSSSFATE